MTEALAQGKVILQGFRILEGGDNLIVGISLLRGGESDKVGLFFGSCGWTRFLLVEDSRLKGSVHFEAAKVSVEGQSISIDIMMLMLEQRLLYTYSW